MGRASMAEQTFDIPAAAQHAKNHHVFRVNAVDDNVFADRETAQAWA